MNANHPESGIDGRPRALNRTSRVIAHYMDDLFTVPGTERRVGLDPLVGLVPGLGDAAGAVATAGLVIDGIRYRVPFVVLLRMAFNLVLDMTIGAIPLLGDAFDFFFRANIRNERLMQKSARRPRRVGEVVETLSHRRADPAGRAGRAHHRARDRRGLGPGRAHPGGILITLAR